MLSKAVFSDANGSTRKPPYSLRMILGLCVILVNPISCHKLFSVLSTAPDGSPYWSYFFSFTLYPNLPGPFVLSSFVSAYLSLLRHFLLVVWFGWEESRSLWPSAQKTIHENVLPQCSAPQARSARLNVKHLKFFSCFTSEIVPLML